MSTKNRSEFGNVFHWIEIVHNSGRSDGANIYAI